MPTGIYKRTHAPWIKGKTKENNEILKLSGERISRKLKELYKERKLKIWNKGLTKETDERIDYNRPTAFKKGEHRGTKTEFKKGNVPYHKNKTKENCEYMKRAGENISKTKNSKEWKGTKGKLFSQRISLVNKGNHSSPKTEFKKGMIPWNKGLTKESDWRIGITLKKLSAIRQGIPLEEWKEYVSFKPYTQEFNNKFKRAIRKRDNQVCMMCGIHREKLSKALSVHHINYDKKLSIPQNCISLCRNCHMKTNFNRKVWTKHFQLLLNERYDCQYSESGDIKVIMKGGENG